MIEEWVKDARNEARVEPTSVSRSTGSWELLSR